MENNNIYKKLHDVVQKFFEIGKLLDINDNIIISGDIQKDDSIFEGANIEMDLTRIIHKFYSDYVYAYTHYWSDGEIEEFIINFDVDILDNPELATEHYNSLFSTYEKFETIYPEISKNHKKKQLARKLSYHRKEIKDIKKQLKLLENDK